MYRANSVRITILLFEQLIDDLARASDAISNDRPDVCAQEIRHAITVIRYLQATLRRGADQEVTRNLGRFYTMMCEKLVEAQVRSSPEILEQIARKMIEIREVFARVKTVHGRAVL